MDITEAYKSIKEIASILEYRKELSGTMFGCAWNDKVVAQKLKDCIECIEQDSKVVPIEPTEEMWSGLARDIVMWMVMGAPHHGSNLHTHLRMLGKDIPEWLIKEIPDIAHTPPKGTMAVCIYKAMLGDAL